MVPYPSAPIATIAPDVLAPVAPRHAQPLVGRRILVVTESLGPINGVTRATEEFLRYLDAEDVQTGVVAPEYVAASHACVPEGVPCVRLRGLPLPYNPELRIVTPFRLREVFRRTVRPDLIYLASPATLGFQVWLQARKAGIPMVANYQTDLASYARLSLPRQIGAVASWVTDELTSTLYRDPLVRTVLCPSTTSRDYLMRLGVREGKIHIVRRGVDCVLFDPRKRSETLRARLAPNGETLLLCVSRLGLEKGFAFLADAYAALVAHACPRITRPRFRLVVTGGNTNPAIERTVRDYFAARGLDVHFTGILTGEALAEMYASADLFVFPSQTETFGQVIQEAMASGLPVVAQRRGGPADLVRSGVTGHLTDPGDTDAFAMRTLQLIEDDDQRAHMGRTARAIAEKRGWAAINRQIAHLMAETLT